VPHLRLRARPCLQTVSSLSERDYLPCVGRHQAFALGLPPMGAGRFRVYKQEPGFRTGSREREVLPLV
jgi:hypothetical protein